MGEQRVMFCDLSLQSLETEAFISLLTTLAFQ